MCSVGIKVSVVMATSPIMPTIVPDSVQATSTARLSGAAKLCVLALEQTEDGAFSQINGANLEAADCALYVNSTGRSAISTTEGSRVLTSFSCTGGGFTAGGSYRPAPVTDCPGAADPLAGRKPPTVGDCDHTDMAVSDGSVTLNPGVYCGGLKISGMAEVTLKPGVYVIKDGPLQVSESAAMRGRYVGFYLTGKRAVFEFKDVSRIELGAPRDGPMASLLVFEDRENPTSHVHVISSPLAVKFLGTFYLPKGTLRVEMNRPRASLLLNRLRRSPFKGRGASFVWRVGSMSEYTAVVARRIEMNGAVMVINSDYAASDVPLPAGLGDTSLMARIYLSQ